ncbi:SEC14-like protein 1 isoform X2 [Amphibalanus amphitrite]|uniref:SEC14-like protein 1 isoform X2 n=1 Tax=Amphibalanus amphitrite TaxID=1232801 RepID=UPI001C91086D|nr:SEC14-like protein 1 isoform X2 [Amphibalanus amphitrite]XP_043195395.1 SEC14-like protein 1 isoform X2 [Amphibalanus amphitrite]XP_043195396.1 SEC14-like protein 1 isoform X2 [Amphibalanus amphitrite]
MVQKYTSPIRVYKYPFELVMEAYERRFPTCDMIPILANTEKVVEEKSEDGAEHVVERKCSLHVDVPYLLKKIMGVEYIYFRQKNSLDRRARTLHIEAWNESYATRVVISENCRYTVHPENPDWTCFEQTASLDVKSFFGFESTVEKIAMKQYSASISKGKEIIEHFIAQLREEGITHVAPFEGASTAVPAVTVTEDQEQRRVRTDLSDLELSGADNDSENQLVSATQLHRRRSTADTDGRSQLEADYIQRCLGNLTPLQESQLIQLRTMVSELVKGKTPGDATLLRFLRAREFHVERAREMISASLVWRKKYQVDRILQEYQSPSVVRDHFPGGWHHSDRDGRPLYVLRLGQMDVKGLIKSIGEEGLLKLVLHICEEGLRLAEEATMREGRPICSWTLLADLDGLNMRHLWRPGIKCLLRIIEIMEANYPETMGRVLIIQAPRVFPILWTLVSTFIDERTRDKFLFCDDDDFEHGLKVYIPEQHIPVFLGGKAECGISEGGLIPKTMYMPIEELEKQRAELCGDMDSIYHCVSLARGQVHEVLILNDDRGSVICWDFDIMKSDVAFSVLRTKVPITHKDEAHAHAHSGPLQVLDSLNPLSEDAEHRSVIDKNWKEGVDYFRVEPTLICHDGESVQGTHVTAHLGTYILQWRYQESASGHHGSPLELIDSITAHKARIMYFYETLRSADYKGSMTSLNSGTSGFSSLSSHSHRVPSTAASSAVSR